MASAHGLKTLYDKILAAMHSGDLRRACDHAVKLVRLGIDNFSGWHPKAAIHGELAEVGAADAAFVKAAARVPAKQERIGLYEQQATFSMQTDGRPVLCRTGKPG